MNPAMTRLRRWSSDKSVVGSGAGLACAAEAGATEVEAREGVWPLGGDGRAVWPVRAEGAVADGMPAARAAAGVVTTRRGWGAAIAPAGGVCAAAGGVCSAVTDFATGRAE